MLPNADVASHASAGQLKLEYTKRHGTIEQELQDVSQQLEVKVKALQELRASSMSMEDHQRVSLPHCALRTHHACCFCGVCVTITRLAHGRAQCFTSPHAPEWLMLKFMPLQ